MNVKVNTTDFNLSQLIKNVTLQNPEGYKHVGMLAILTAKFQIIGNMYSRHINTIMNTDFTKPSLTMSYPSLFNIVFASVLILLSFISIALISFIQFLSNTKKFVQSFFVIVLNILIASLGLLGLIYELYGDDKFLETYQSLFCITTMIILFIRIVITVPIKYNMPSFVYPIIYLMWLDRTKLTSTTPLFIAICYSIFIHLFSNLFAKQSTTIIFVISEITTLPFMIFTDLLSNQYLLHLCLCIFSLIDLVGHINVLTPQRPTIIKKKKD
ncbi:Transmembrane protein [Entamoeba marina]